MKDEIAILMAAGIGTRMRPITDKTPKPLVKVLGKPMIETLIDALEYRGVSNIYVVVGYLGSQFYYLEKKYNNLTVIENIEYATMNNISSIHVVVDKLRRANCMICEADLYIPDVSVLANEHKKSCYYGKKVQGYSDDWVFYQDDHGRITHICKGGYDCYNMCGISYFLREDAAIVADAIGRYHTKSYESLFWDEVVDTILDKIELEVYPIDMSQIIELDTVEELSCIDPSYEIDRSFEID